MTRGFTEVTRRLKAVFSGGNAGGHSGNVGGDSGNVGDTEDTRGGPYGRVRFSVYEPVTQSSFGTRSPKRSFKWGSAARHCWAGLARQVF